MRCCYGLVNVYCIEKKILLNEQRVHEHNDDDCYTASMAHPIQKNNSLKLKLGWNETGFITCLSNE